MLRIAVNGYGRIGRSVVRALFEQASNDYRKHIQLVAINELADLETMCYLTRYDSTHGRFPADVCCNADDANNELVIDGQPIAVFHEQDISALDWSALDVDLVLECTGSFSDRKTAELHVQQGASQVLFSQPASNDVDATIVYGVNHQVLDGSEIIVSNASCTTNCIVPVIHVLDQLFGVHRGTITTVHSAMNDQPVIDAYHSDLRRTRSAGQSIIPVDTGLAAGIERILPKFKGAFVASHMRVPTQNVSVMDVTLELQGNFSVEHINQALFEASQKELDGVLGFTREPHASIDFNHDAHSGIVDATQTQIVEGDQRQLLKLVVWFDNEWAFANRMLDTALVMAP